MKLKKSDGTAHALLAAAALKHRVPGIRAPRYRRCVEAAREKIQLY